MPDTAGSPRDVLAKVMSEGRKTLVPHLAEMLKRTQIKEIDTSEERQRFWQRAITPEQEQLLWQEGMARLGTLELTPDQALDLGLQISKRVYPDRWDMLGGEGRDAQSDQAMWAWKQAQKGPPTPKAEEGM